jgi:sulfur carrier protein ThiS
MIKIRLATFENDNEQEIEIVSGETISEALKRCLESHNITENPKHLFNVAVNAMNIPSEFWDTSVLKESDTVLVVTKLKDARQAGQVLVVLAVALTAAYTGGASMSWWAAGLINAGVAVVSSYLVSQLIPPPKLDVADIGGDIKSSQVYSITSQSNSINKYGYVPKVYGQHRMFPLVAANPYTELEADPQTGVYSQYLYCIYDFGFGPVKIEDLKIGNTPISAFDQVTYNFVDPNRPDADEGAWDNGVLKDFRIYKGDITSESINTTIDGNQNEGDPADQYLAVRSASSNPLFQKQEYTVNLICPRGLYGIDSYGNIDYRNIELFVEYSPVSSETWKPFNDPATVERFSFVGGGGSQAYTDVQLNFINPDNSNPFSGTRFGLVSETPLQTIYNGYPGPSFASGNFTKVYRRTVEFGVPIGSTTAILSGEAEIGNTLKVGERTLGVITNKVFYLNITGVDYFTYTLAAPTTFAVSVYTYTETKIEQYVFFSITGTTLGYELDYSTRGQVKREVLIPGKFQIRANTQEQHFATLKFTPITPGNYKVRITRLSTSSNATTNVQDNLTWIGLSTRTNTAPIRTDKRHTFMEIKIKATGQLNGAIQNLSALCTSVLDTWNGVAWVKQPTRNPAWIYADILTGEVTKNPVAKSRLHIPSLVEWANHCNQVPPSGGAEFAYTLPRYSCDFVLDFATTVQNLLQQITSACQATPNIIDGKYGVLLDINRTVPVQLFTPRNSWGFGSTRSYNNKPNAVRVKFIDPSRDWQQNEILVYDTGFNAGNATEFQDLETFGVTNYEQAQRYGKFFTSQHRLRQETYQLRVDYENLVCTRGDFVLITQDVMKVGGLPARVKTVSGNQITIDDNISILPVSYGYTFRKSDGQILTSTLTVVNSSTFTLAGAIPAVGDLIVVGEVGEITFECIVKQIAPEADYTATLHLVEKATELYSFETVLTANVYEPKIPQSSDYSESPPPEVTSLQVIDNYNVVTDTGVNYFIHIDWDMPVGSSFESFEVYIDNGKGYELSTVLRNSEYIYQVQESKVGIEHKFKVLAVSSTGKKLVLGEVGFVAATPLLYVEAVPDVQGFSNDISNQTIHFSWTGISRNAIVNYMIRYYPEITGGTWETSTIVNVVSANTTLYSTQARLGTYFIKAIASDGRQSVNASQTITTVPVLANMNFIDLIDDFPGILGSVERVVKGSSVLILDQSVFGPLGTEQFYADGYYYFNDILDLGEIFTVRLTSKIIAEAISYQDLMVNWPNLNDVPALSTSGADDWDSELQYQAMVDFVPISDWVSLSSIPVIGDGEGEATDWRKFLAGDATGQQFRFRLKLTSYNPSVTPRVTSAQVLVEMQTRTLNLQGLTAPASPLAVNYPEAFYGPGSSPNVQITINNGQSGDYYQFSSRTLTGFTIAFFDSLNNAVSRQFDASVVGYGRQANNII